VKASASKAADTGLSSGVAALLLFVVERVGVALEMTWVERNGCVESLLPLFASHEHRTGENNEYEACDAYDAEDEP